MNAIVVYESLWGNTAAIARAIADGVGSGALALSTAQATPELVAEADLIVAGAPLLGFGLPTNDMRASIGKSSPGAPTPPDLSNPSMRDWIASLPSSSARCASFETRIWWSPGSAAKSIAKLLEGQGMRPADEPQRFIVTGRYGPLKDGELERAKQWGARLASAGG
jgi:flavodoxin